MEGGGNRRLSCAAGALDSLWLAHPHVAFHQALGWAAPGPLMAPPPPRPQEIDGKALLLLRSDVMMKYMGLKLGPALKLSYHIERLKQGKF